MIKEIEKLNKEIDRIMTEKTKADAQKEVWESRLIENIKDYEKDYGIDLSGKDLSEIKKKIIAETNIVEAKTKEEFERSSKIVSLINEGDIKGAWKALGIDTAVTKDEEKEETKVQSAVKVEEIEDEDFYGESLDEFEDGDEYIDSYEPVNLTPKVNTKVEFQEKPKAGSFNPFVVEGDDDDEDEDEFIIPNTADKSNEETLAIEDDEDDFGGFGSILAGSKFKV